VSGIAQLSIENNVKSKDDLHKLGEKDIVTLGHGVSKGRLKYLKATHVANQINNKSQRAYTIPGQNKPSAGHRTKKKNTAATAERREWRLFR
jgi:hypothetical protein